MTVIKPNAILVDRRGHEWTTAPGFQDREVNGPGWLLLRSNHGEELPWADVHMRYAIDGPDGKRYLRGHYAPTCAHCGGPQRGYGSVNRKPLCHPDEGLDCYSLVTMAGHGMPCDTVDADRRYCNAVDDFLAGLAESKEVS